MDIRLLLKVVTGLLFSSVAYAHPGHEHVMATQVHMIHTIANNSLTWLLLLFVVIGARSMKKNNRL